MGSHKLKQSSSAPAALKPLSLQPRFGSATFSSLPPPPKLPKTAPSSSRPAPVKAEESQARDKGKRRAELDEEDDLASDLLWVDRYAPQTRDALGVHPAKFKDVDGWLSEAFLPKLAKYRRLLVLSGPAGAGKTAALRVLAREAGVDIVEYRNPSNFKLAGEYGGESVVSSFTSFLTRAGMAPALDFGPDPDQPLFNPTSSSQSQSQSASQPSTSDSAHVKKRLILLEDLPNVSHYPTKLALRSALSQFLKSPRVTCPLVLIISEVSARPGMGPEAESAGGDGSSRGESLDARSVCGMDVLGAVGCREIKFNPVAVTILTKALTRTVNLAYSPSGPYPNATPPSAETLKLLANHSNGDLRSALMSLEFLASEPVGREAGAVTSLGSGGAGASKKRKADGGGQGSRKEQVLKLLQFVTARESSLFLFHALGKVLWNKRWGQSDKDDKADEDRAQIRQFHPEPKLPRHLREQFARLPSKVDTDVLFAEAPLDSDVFMSYVHHNYTPFTDDIDQCALIMDGISAADALMRTEGEEWLRRAPLTSQYSFNVSVRSTLLHLPSPVPKRKQTLRKSALWENLKMTAANEDTIVDWSRTAHSGGQSLVMLGKWEDGTGGGMRSGRAVRTEMVPYVGRIGRKLDGASSATVAFLKQLATFPPVKGSNYRPEVDGEGLGDYAVEDDEEEMAESGVLDVPVEGRSKLEEVEEEPEEDELDELAEELLYDPDDDIEDDD